MLVSVNWPMEKYLSTYQHSVGVWIYPDDGVKRQHQDESKKDIVYTYFVPFQFHKYSTMNTGSIFIPYTVLVSTLSTYP